MTDNIQNELPKDPVILVEVPQSGEAAEPVSEAAPATSVENQEVKKPATQAEIITRLQAIAENVESAPRQGVDILKQAFYKLHNQLIESQKKAFIEAGGQESEFKPDQDPLEARFKELMNVIKEKRTQQNLEQEKQRNLNYQIKLSIIEELKELTESPDDPNKNYTEFKKLQQQWNEVTFIPQEKANELWKNYQIYVEKFYDLLKLNNEFREYDFKKNLEVKNAICAKAEQLAEAEDVVYAFHQLQKLHQEYRETGPVAKELREEVWARFKAASTTINRKHQQHFEALKEAEQQNLDQKVVICEIVEAIDFEALSSFQLWDQKTQEVIALQNKWKSIGYTSAKNGNKVFDRFRKACDVFFAKKAEYYKSIKNSFQENLEKKRQLCEKAEALKDSTQWKETAEELAKLQQEWKTIGPVAKKHSEAIWKRFVGACDHFFEQKNKLQNSQRSEEQENLVKKKSIIRQLEEINAMDEVSSAMDKVKELMAEWNKTGHVPFRDKDKIYKAYHDIVDGIHAKARKVGQGRRAGNLRNAAHNLKESGKDAVTREREKLIKAYDSMLQELHTYENNMGFLSAASSKGNSLINAISNKIDKLKEDIKTTKEKIDRISKEKSEQE